MTLLNLKSFSDRVRYIELRVSLNTNDAEEVISKLKEIKKTIFLGIGGIEIGEKEGFKNVPHLHCVILYQNAKTIQSLINEIGIMKMKNEDDEQLGFDIKSIPKENIIERINYIYKEKTKINKRRIYEYNDVKFWELFYEVKKIDKKVSKRKTAKTAVENQMERLKIATDIIYDDILTSEDPDVIEHKGYFATNAGIKFYGSVRDKQIQKTIRDTGYKYNCLPNPDLNNKGRIHIYQNILISGFAGSGKTRTMLYFIEHILNKKVYSITPRPYMDRYDPRVYDYNFWDDIDATDIKEFGGIAKFKKMTDGKPFTYEEKYMKACLSDYKPWWMTSNTEHLTDFKDKNDKNDNYGLGAALERRFHHISINEFCMNFGIKWDKLNKKYIKVEPIPLIHVNGHYRRLDRYENECMEREDKC